MAVAFARRMDIGRETYWFVTDGGRPARDLGTITVFHGSDLHNVRVHVFKRRHEDYLVLEGNLSRTGDVTWRDVVRYTGPTTRKAAPGRTLYDYGPVIDRLLALYFARLPVLEGQQTYRLVDWPG